MFHHVDLFKGATSLTEVTIPWRPKPLDHTQWPPNYTRVCAWRMEMLQELRSNPIALRGAKLFYRQNIGQFIMDWMDTYDPRKDGIKWIPFVFFAKQSQVIQFFDQLIVDGENGLVEKCRDFGLTWLACGWSVGKFIFEPDFAIGWGSRKEQLVDKIGDPDSIFEKMRMLLRRLPDVFMPQGFKWRDHATYLKLINPENGSTITGEAGDNIGRGGRKTAYFKDEAAHYERPEKIQAALDDNTNVQIDISSVNGVGNVFHRRREAGIDWHPNADIPKGFTRVLVADWRDHPAKTQEWYDTRKAKAEREGMQHILAQEVDRNYSASVINTIIEYDWINAAVDAHLTIPYLVAAGATMPNVWRAGLDVADGGQDRNAMVLRQWIICRDVKEWGERDTGLTTDRAIALAGPHKGIVVEYDCIGVGSGVKTRYNQLRDMNIVIPPFRPWDAGAGVFMPFDRIIEDDDESAMNKDMFYNFKAQAWWSVRTRFYKTWRAVTYGDVYKPDELISLDSRMILLAQLKKELAQAQKKSTNDLRLVVDKTPEGMRSPNLADALIMAFFPTPDNIGQPIVGGYGV